MYSQGSTMDLVALYVTATQIHKKQKKNILIVLTDGDGNSVEGDAWKIMSPKSKYTIGDLKNVKHTVKILKKTYPELLIMAVPVACNPKYWT